ncbi:MAG: hypothetical protein EOO20_08590 [Chryseobacterium sp.]|nr:MAG: hypothetical protein EOO20_08590 [Chryseobacterium sp.]
MKQKLIALLKTSFASKGFNAKELEALADLVIGQHTLTDESTDEDLSTAVTAAKPTADFVQSVASRQVSDVKKPAKVEITTTTTEQKTDVDPNETATDKALRLIMEKLEKQEQTIASFGQEKVANTRRDQFIQSMKGTSAEYQAKELKRFDRITFKDDEDFSGFLEDTKEDHAAAVQEEANAGMGGDRPVGGQGGNASLKKEATDAEVNAAVDSII